MGYCMWQSDTEFRVPADKVHAAYEAVKNLAGKESIKDSSGSHFRWVDSDFTKAKTFEEIMHEWRWEVETDDEGALDIISINFCGEKLGDDKVLFDAIAPFVDNGSYIEMHGEEGGMWRWVFDGKSCKEINPNISWPEK